jgi:16S rRNA (cytosine967-C5)-methyltransferase
MPAECINNMFCYDKGVLRELERVYGGHGLSKFLEAIARPPTRYYIRVNVLRAEPLRLLDDMREKGLEVYSDEFLEEALWLPVRGPNNVRDTGCYVVVDKRAAESVMMGAHVYAPGVVRVDECAKPGAEVTVVSENGVLVANGVVEEGFSAALRVKKGLVVRNVRPLYSVPSLRDTEWSTRGMIYEQSISSMLVARVLDPEPGSIIVDMCAAPGGKTSHVYELVRGRARIIAIDHSASKTRRLRENLERLGHRSVEIIRMDARYADLELGKGVADYVVLDPPCTSLGVVPKIYDSKSLRDVRVSARYQRQFLRAAYGLLRSGGVLVYSTCTVTLSENEENIRYATEKLGFRALEPPSTTRLFAKGIGFCNDCFIRVHPHVHGATGYFVAKLVKP